MNSFISCIQMNADANEHCPEREMILSPHLQMLQAVIVEDTAVDTFAVSLPAFFGIPWDVGMEAEASMVLHVDGTPIVSEGNIFCVGRNLCGRILTGNVYGVVAPWVHFMPGRAEEIPSFTKK